MTRKMRDITSSAPVGMASSDTVSAVAKAMRERGVGTALVLADGIPVGVVSTGDLDPFTPSAPGS